MKYFDELKKAMNFLSENHSTIFIGQAVAVPGTAMRNTLTDIPVDKLIELRNSVDKLEQAAEIVRNKRDDEELFLSFKKLNTSSITTKVKAFSKKISKLVKNVEQQETLEGEIKEIRSRYKNKVFAI